jgi:methyltransferase family protein
MRRVPNGTSGVVERLIAGIEGWLSLAEATYLHELAARAPGAGVVVEIGSYQGKSTVVLAHASRAAGRERVVAIDPFNGGASSAFRENVARAGVAGHVEPVVARSNDVAAGWTTPVRLVWIDGNHSFEQARDDLRNWAPHVVPGGIVAFHDTYQWDGVRRVVDEQALRSPDLVLIGLVDTIAAFRKVARPSIAARAKHHAMAAGRFLYAMNRRPVHGEARLQLKRALRAWSTV